VTGCLPRTVLSLVLRKSAWSALTPNAPRWPLPCVSPDSMSSMSWSTPAMRSLAAPMVSVSPSSSLRKLACRRLAAPSAPTYIRSVHRPRVDARHTPSAAPHRPCRGRRPFYLRAIARLLRTAPLDVLTAEGSEAALAVADQHEGSIDLLLTDVVLPGHDGPALAAQLRARRPKLVVIFMSGYDIDILAKHGAHNVDTAHFLSKPIARERLHERVAQALTPVRA
jgi:CheY-like chemotaxis protein